MFNLGSNGIVRVIRRREFRRAVNPPLRHLRGLGFVFRCRRDAAGKLTADPPLRTIQHAELIAAPGMTS